MGCAGHAIAVGGGPGVCVCRASSAGGNRSCRDLLLERPVSAAALLVLLSAQMCPAAQCPQLSCQGRGWAFWARQGDSAEAPFSLPPEEAGVWGCDVWCWGWGFGPELESGSDQVCPMCHRSNSEHDCCSYSCYKLTAAVALKWTVWKWSSLVSERVPLPAGWGWWPLASWGWSQWLRPSTATGSQQY